MVTSKITPGLIGSVCPGEQELSLHKHGRLNDPETRFQIAAHVALCQTCQRRLQDAKPMHKH